MDCSVDSCKSKLIDYSRQRADLSSTDLPFKCQTIHTRRCPSSHGKASYNRAARLYQTHAFVRGEAATRESGAHVQFSLKSPKTESTRTSRQHEVSNDILKAALDLSELLLPTAEGTTFVQPRTERKRGDRLRFATRSPQGKALARLQVDQTCGLWHSESVGQPQRKWQGTTDREAHDLRMTATSRAISAVLARQGTYTDERTKSPPSMPTNTSCRQILQGSTLTQRLAKSFSLTVAGNGSKRFSLEVADNGSNQHKRLAVEVAVQGPLEPPHPRVASIDFAAVTRQLLAPASSDKRLHEKKLPSTANDAGHKPTLFNALTSTKSSFDVSKSHNLGASPSKRRKRSRSPGRLGAAHHGLAARRSAQPSSCMERARSLSRTDTKRELSSAFPSSLSRVTGMRSCLGSTSIRHIGSGQKLFGLSTAERFLHDAQQKPRKRPRLVAAARIAPRKSFWNST